MAKKRGDKKPDWDLDKMMEETGFSAEAYCRQESEHKADERAPRLPETGEQSRPNLIFLDDDFGFLELAKNNWNTHYQESFTLHCLLLDGRAEFDPGDGVDAVLTSTKEILEWLLERIPELYRPVLFLDRHHSIFQPEDLLPSLRKQDSLRYVPVAFMTVAERGINHGDMDDMIAAGAQRILYNKVASPLFLYECGSIVDQLYHDMEGHKWRDLHQCLTEDFGGLLDDEEVWDNFKQHLNKLFDVSHCFFRQQGDDGGLEWCIEPCGSEAQVAPQCLKPADVPLLRQLLEGKGVIRRDVVSREELGENENLNPLLGQRLLAAPLRQGNRVLGTLTLYRNPRQSPFTRRDEQHIEPVAQELAAWLANQQIRRRQRELLEFATRIAGAEDEENILQLLVRRLHCDIHLGDSLKSKVTCRILSPDYGQLTRAVSPVGVQPENDLDHDMIDIDDERSIYAECVRSNDLIRCDDIRNQPCGERYLVTTPEMRSCLTVPLTTDAGLRLGAVNLENRRPGFYRQDDETHTKAACRLAANTLQRLRSDRFKRDLIDLVKLRDASEEQILARLYRALAGYLRFGRLIAVEPGAKVDSPWRVRSVVLPDGQLAGEVVLQEWRNHIEPNWSATYAHLCISQAEIETVGVYIENDAAKYLDDKEIGIATRSEVVIVLRGSTGRAEKALVMLFRLSDAVTQDMQALLDDLAALLDELLRGQRARVHGYMNQAVNPDLDEAMQSMRHTMRGVLGALFNKIERFKSGGMESNTFVAAMEEIQTRLAAVWKNYRHLLKSEPEPMEVSIAGVWREAAEAARGENALTSGPVVPLRESGDLHWRTDPDLLRAILANLIQNACETNPPAERIWLNIGRNEEGKELHLLLCNDGPPIPAEDQSRLFDLGFTTKTTGTGFGLSYCRDLARRLGGDLFLSDSNDEMICFDLLLPFNFNGMDE